MVPSVGAYMTIWLALEALRNVLYKFSTYLLACCAVSASAELLAHSACAVVCYFGLGGYNRLLLSFVRNIDSALCTLASIISSNTSRIVRFVRT